MQSLNLLFNKIKENFRTSKLRFILLFFCYIFSALLIITMPLFTYRSGFNNITILLALLFGLSFLLYLIIYGEIYIDFYIISFVCYLAISFLSTLIGSKDFYSWRTILTTGLLGMSLFEFVVSRRSFRFISYCFLCAAFVLCVAIFLEYKTLILSFDFSRLGKLFGDVNDVGLMIATGALFAFFLISREKKIWSLFFLFTLTCVFVLFILLTGSRGALLVFFVSLFVFLFQAFWENHKIVFLLALSSLLFGSIIILNLPFMSELKERIINALVSFVSLGSSGDGSASKRLNMMFEGLQLWASSPLIGNGSDAFRVLSNQNTFSHSTFSELLCSFGIIGAFLWASPMFFYSFCGSKQSKANARLFSAGFILPAAFSFVLTQSKFPLASYGAVMGFCFAEFESRASFMRVLFSKRDIIRIEIRSQSLGFFDWNLGKYVFKKEDLK